jgi:YfiR/HmsC-like
MRRTCLPGPARVTRTAIVAVLLMLSPAYAQDVTEPALKAAGIFNFAKFTVWPSSALPVADPYVLCVLGDAAVASALGRAVKGRELEGRRLTVSSVDPVGPQGGCHILYVSGTTAIQASQLVAKLRDVPVLTISDIDGFTETGGIAQIYFSNGQLRFIVDVPAVKRARLQISSQLLRLAKPR